MSGKHRRVVPSPLIPSTDHHAWLVPLPRGRHATIDGDDGHIAEGRNWGQSPGGHVVWVGPWHRNPRAVIRLDRSILAGKLTASTTGGVDHLDGDPLNCTRSNLRPITRAEISTRSAMTRSRAHAAAEPTHRVHNHSKCKRT